MWIFLESFFAAVFSLDRLTYFSRKISSFTFYLNSNRGQSRFQHLRCFFRRHLHHFGIWHAKLQRQKSRIVSTIWATSLDLQFKMKFLKVLYTTFKNISDLSFDSEWLRPQTRKSKLKFNSAAALLNMWWFDQNCKKLRPAEPEPETYWRWLAKIDQFIF